MAKNKISSDMVHKLPRDLRKAIESDSKVKSVWMDITPLARNEWICWVTSAAKAETRESRIAVALDKMRKGMRRPCCWIGCTHRTDKQISPSQKWVLGKRSQRKF
jgi:hypothetical protein